MSHQDEFPGYITKAEDKQLTDAGLFDRSWHNDNVPFWSNAPDNEEVQTRLGIDHPDPKERDSDEAKRFYVYLDEDGSLEYLFDTDSLADAITAFWFAEIFREDAKLLFPHIATYRIEFVDAHMEMAGSDYAQFVINSMNEMRGNDPVSDVAINYNWKPDEGEAPIQVVKDIIGRDTDVLAECNDAAALAGWLASRQNKGKLLHQQKFPGFITEEEDAYLHEGGFFDWSWGNDTLPVWSNVPANAVNTPAIMLTIDHHDPAKRETTDKRFMVMRDTGDGDEVLFTSDDLDEAILQFWKYAPPSTITTRFLLKWNLPYGMTAEQFMEHSEGLKELYEFLDKYQKTHPNGDLLDFNCEQTTTSR